MHHGDWGRDSGFHWFGLIWMIIVVAATAALVWFAVTQVRRSRPLDNPAPPPAPSVPAASRPSAREILDERLARGEIEVDDYRQRLTALSGPAGAAD